MTQDYSKRLVIDASVGRAAGGAQTTAPEARACGDFLQNVLDICHRLVMTTAIQQEWQEHASKSRFTRSWLVEMVQRNKVALVDLSEDTTLRDTLRKCARDEGAAHAMIKDSHLIEAALATDQTVVSLDERARNHFATVSSSIEQVQQIVWVNPTIESENAVSWLQGGALPEAERCLKYQREPDTYA